MTTKVSAQFLAGQLAFTIVFCCAMTTVILTSCTDNADHPALVVDDKQFYVDDACMDKSVKPGDDFFLYYNGGYWNNTVADEANPFPKLLMGQLFDEMDRRVAALSLPSKTKMLADAEKTDAATIAAQMTRLQSAIGRVNAITTKEEAWKLLAELYMEGYRTPLEPTAFAVNGKMVIALSLPLSKDYAVPQLWSKESLSWRLANDPDLLACVHPLNSAATRGFDNGQWPMLVTFFNTLGVPLDDVYTIDSSSDMIFKNTSGILLNIMLGAQNTSVDEWKPILIQSLAEDAVFLDEEAAAAVSMTCKDAVDNFISKYLKYELSHAFAKAYVTAEQKQLIKGYAEELRQTFRERISRYTWMSEASKQNATEKINNMVFNIGAPDEWFEEGMADLSQEQTLFDDIRAMRRAKMRLICKLTGMTMQRASFHQIILDTPLTTVNSCYTMSGNCMNIFPAFILTPFFDPQQNDAHNYANMTAWGHEITHGFDTNGSRYNQAGDLGMLWASDADSQEFQKRAQQLVDYYSTFDIMPFETGLKNDGAYTVSENVADLGGFYLAYDSYVKHLKQQGFSGDHLRLQQKRFYEAYAYLWRGKWTAAEAIRRTVGDASKGIIKDIHSMFRERVNGIVSNTDDWYDLFDVKAGDKLYLAPDKRIRIW